MGPRRYAARARHQDQERPVHDHHDDAPARRIGAPADDPHVPGYPSVARPRDPPRRVADPDGYALNGGSAAPATDAVLASFQPPSQASSTSSSTGASSGATQSAAFGFTLTTLATGMSLMIGAADNETIASSEFDVYATGGASPADVYTAKNSLGLERLVRWRDVHDDADGAVVRLELSGAVRS